TANSLGLTPNISTPMPDNFDQPKLGRHGGVRAGAGRTKKGEIRERKNQGDNVGDHVTLNSRGNSVDYIVARLRRGASPIGLRQSARAGFPRLPSLSSWAGRSARKPYMGKIAIRPVG